MNGSIEGGTERRGSRRASECVLAERVTGFALWKVGVGTTHPSDLDSQSRRLTNKEEAK